MKMLTCEKLENISFYFVIFILFTLCMGSIFITYQIISLKNFSHFLLGLGFFSFVLYLLYQFQYKKISKLEKMIFILYIVSALSLFSTNHLKISIFGFYNRYEGLLMLYSYYSFALLSSIIKKKCNVEMILSFILFIGIVNVIYGLFQVNRNSQIPVVDSWKYAKGFLGNSMNYSLLISIGYFITMGIVFEYHHMHIIFKLLLLIIFTVGNVISGSMSMLLTTAFLSIILVAFNISKLTNKMNIGKLLICIVIFFLFFFGFLHNNKIYKRDVNELIYEAKTFLVERKIDNQFGTGRIYIWKNVLKKSSKHLLFGVGVDNLFYSFNPRLIDQVSGDYVDKAHNDYLQKLLCEGVISFLFYISFLICLIFNNYRKKDSLKKILLYGFLSYVICVFINISVIRVAPIFWIIIGLLVSDFDSIRA